MKACLEEGLCNKKPNTYIHIILNSVLLRRRQRDRGLPGHRQGVHRVSTNSRHSVAPYPMGALSKSFSRARGWANHPQHGKELQRYNGPLRPGAQDLPWLLFPRKGYYYAHGVSGIARRPLTTFTFIINAVGSRFARGHYLRRAIVAWTLRSFPERKRTQVALQELALLIYSWLFDPKLKAPRRHKLIWTLLFLVQFALA